MMCKHENFKIEGVVNRLTDTEEADAPVTGYHMDLTVHCADCMMPFKFKGMQVGYSPSRPTTNFEQVEARLPIEPV